MIQLASRRGLGGFDELTEFLAILGHALASDHQSAKEAFLLEGDGHLAAAHLVPAVNRTGVGNLLAVLLGQGPTGQAHPRVQLVVIVNASRVGGINIGLDNHAYVLAVLDGELVLNLADVGKAYGVGIG